MGNSAWHVKGKNPFDYLQATDLVAASAGIDVTNAPVYYSRLIMAYVAMDRAGTIGTAGSKGVNLLNLLLTYQNTTDGSPTKGAFAPSLPSVDAAVRTTSWAILAMHNAGVSQSDSRFLMAEAWLAAQQNDLRRRPRDGGFPSSERRRRVGRRRHGAGVPGAHRQLPTGTDWDPVARTDVPQDRPEVQRRVPGDAGRRHRRGGDLRRHPGHPRHGRAPGGRGLDRRDQHADTRPSRTCSRPTAPTGSIGPEPPAARHRDRWVLVALNRKPFTTYPKNPGSAHKAFKFRPLFKSVSPKNGAKFKSHIVLIRATYTDFYPKGTGIKPSACRLYVDNKNKSRPADIGRYGLHLQLKNVPNGDHTYKIELRDHAGNAKVIERKFVVAVPTPVPDPHADDAADVLSRPSIRPCTPRTRRRPSRTSRRRPRRRRTRR